MTPRRVHTSYNALHSGNLLRYADVSSVLYEMLDRAERSEDREKSATLREISRQIEALDHWRPEKITK